MRYHKALYAFIFLLFYIPISAQSLNKKKLIIYYFNDESDTQKYRYYSYIIPDSLAVELKNKIDYDVIVLPLTFKYISSNTNEEEKLNEISIIVSRGKEANANYSVIGSYKVYKNIINIQVQICNIDTGQITDTSQLNEEIGVLIYEIIDKLTVKINQELQKPIEEEKLATSPYKNLYSSLQNIYFGYSYHYVFLKDNWDDIYNDTNMSRLSLGIPVSKIYSSDITIFNRLFVAPTWQFFSTNNRDIDHIYDSYLSVYMGGISLQYYHPLSQLLYVSCNLDAGLAYSDIYIVLMEGNGPFSPHIEKSSSDPYFLAGINAIIYFYSLGFSSGINYLKIFYQKNDFDAVSINFGIHYRL